MLEPRHFMQQLLDVISNQMPKNESDLQHYRRILEEPTKLLHSKLKTYFGLQDLATPSNMTMTSISNEERKSTLAIVDVDGLLRHLENLSSIFAYIRRRDILKHARAIVMEDYHNTMITTGDALEDELATAGDIGDPRGILDQSGSIAIQKLKFDSCQISLTACRLLKFVHDVLRQACSASMNVANVLFHSARDCLELFLVIVPTKFADTIEHIPRMGAVYFNDCLYIAYNAVLMTHKYRQEILKQKVIMNEKEKLYESLQASISFIDFIPRLRKCAEKCLQHHVAHQQRLLQEMIYRMNVSPDRDSKSINISRKPNLLTESFKIAGKLKNKLLHSGTVEGIRGMSMTAAAVESTSETIKEEDGIDSTDLPPNNENRAVILVHHLEKLSSQWFGVLQDEYYGRMMSLLIDNVLQEAMKPVLNADCITATSASEIHRIFKVLQRARFVQFAIFINRMLFSFLIFFVSII
jgi:hypothetical protein